MPPQEFIRNVEKLEPLCTLGGNLDGTDAMENNMAIPWKN